MLLNRISAGRYTTRAELVHHDTADESTQSTIEAHISSFCCSQSLGSFYNAAGDIEGEQKACHNYCAYTKRLGGLPIG